MPALLRKSSQCVSSVSSSSGTAFWIIRLMIHLIKVSSPAPVKLTRMLQSSPAVNPTNSENAIQSLGSKPEQSSMALTRTTSRSYLKLAFLMRSRISVIALSPVIAYQQSSLDYHKFGEILSTENHVRR